jgi:putative ABC transport system substrate-binding protein
MNPIRGAAPQLSIDFILADANTEREIETALRHLASQSVDAVLVGADPFYMERRREIVGIAAGFRLAAIYPFREFVAAGDS